MELTGSQFKKQIWNRLLYMYIFKNWNLYYFILDLFYLFLFPYPFILTKPFFKTLKPIIKKWYDFLIFKTFPTLLFKVAKESRNQEKRGLLKKYQEKSGNLISYALIKKFVITINCISLLFFSKKFAFAIFFQFLIKF